MAALPVPRGGRRSRRRAFPPAVGAAWEAAPRRAVWGASWGWGSRAGRGAAGPREGRRRIWPCSAL